MGVDTRCRTSGLISLSVVSGLAHTFLRGNVLGLMSAEVVCRVDIRVQRERSALEFEVILFSALNLVVQNCIMAFL